ncbi:IclR family transcriptional regulator [Petroclostridium sp. X23]|uniref:IclR family transcriptional regulator n=1 Tax=Petroclostridium sp. X23 TaxID=3045146 RepID=UPI0024AE1F4A|nr:IclR family transcriptional regulator [Petroclostridium sp. X23]WHH60572.1 IclR family transcriptional regulator [Petroclostridium sp. X23]
MQDVKEKVSIKNQSVEKVLNIIELLSEKQKPMRIQDIAKELGMNSSTVVRFLATLVSCGYVAQDRETLKYYLTYKICAIANRVSSDIEIRDILQPFTQAVAAVFDESVCLAIEQDMSMVYIDVIQGQNQMLRAMQRIGNVAPMHCTGVGKLLLLNHDEAYIDKMIFQKGLTKFTDNTIITKRQLMNELDKVRIQGYSIDDEECEIGAKCVAVPIRGFSGKIVAAISITGPISRMNDIITDKNIEYLKETAYRASKKLGYEE